MWPFKKKEEAIIEKEESVEVESVKDEGLQKIITVGEQIPWKGIWFAVVRVEKDLVEFAPIRTTWKKQKQIQKSKSGGR